ncbi:hypothetical protein [Marmoricola endophyticus]|uniref:hypothetical protein n=1 Tax=Marmoricola endophyticus TaxID=2040280 RepID=UPI00166672C9|nr:hypothetical protein [Marmoricola endophyticus]
MTELPPLLPSVPEIVASLLVVLDTALVLAVVGLALTGRLGRLGAAGWFLVLFLPVLGPLLVLAAGRRRTPV